MSTNYKLIYPEIHVMNPDCAMFTEKERKKLGYNPAR